MTMSTEIDKQINRETRKNKIGSGEERKKIKLGTWNLLRDI